MTSNTATVREHARYGAATQQEFDGPLPQPFPREIGPRAVEYLAEVVDSGLTCDMVDRFEQAFAEAHGVAHCIATPGCTPALAVLAAAFGFEPGDEIVVSSVSDYGTVQGLISAGYIPVFADAAPGTINVNAETIEGVHFRAHSGDPRRASDRPNLRHGRHQRSRCAPRPSRL